MSGGKTAASNIKVPLIVSSIGHQLTCPPNIIGYPFLVANCPECLTFLPLLNEWRCVPFLSVISISLVASTFFVKYSPNSISISYLILPIVFVNIVTSIPVKAIYLTPFAIEVWKAGVCIMQEYASSIQTSASLTAPEIILSGSSNGFPVDSYFTITGLASKIYAAFATAVITLSSVEVSAVMTTFSPAFVSITSLTNFIAAFETSNDR